MHLVQNAIAVEGHLVSSYAATYKRDILAMTPILLQYNPKLGNFPQ